MSLFYRKGRRESWVQTLGDKDGCWFRCLSRACEGACSSGLESRLLGSRGYCCPAQLCPHLSQLCDPTRGAEKTAAESGPPPL